MFSISNVSTVWLFKEYVSVKKMKPCLDQDVDLDRNTDTIQDVYRLIRSRLIDKLTTKSLWSVVVELTDTLID